MICMGEKYNGEEETPERTGRKSGRGKKKITKAHRFYRNRVWAFTILAVLFPWAGFGFWALSYTKKFEKHSETGIIPLLLIINYISMVVCCIIWLVFAIFAFLFIVGLLSL
ncbi:MAG: hypothetical protein ACMUIG_03600 [Thermoplasmatota archaeon]